MTDAVIDPLAPRVATGATGLLRSFNEAGVIDAADVHTANRLTGLGGEPSEVVALAVAMAVRALRHGSVCVDLSGVAAGIDDPVAAMLPWPEPQSWLTAVRNSSLVECAVLRVSDDGLLYLDRYWREEQQVCTDLLALSAVPVSSDESADDIHSGASAVLDRLFALDYAEQRAAAQTALRQAVTVITGGPGSGKTTTVARLLAALADQAQRAGRSRLRIALAAPTGKAAARLTQAVAGQVSALVDEKYPIPEPLRNLSAATLHSLLGVRPGSQMRFRHNRTNRLPHDVIVVDETSMVSLTMMARLLEAVRPGSRLILVGDPDQLASVEAGAVLADLVDGLIARPGHPIVTLHTSHRHAESIGALAAAIRAGNADRVVGLLKAGGEQLQWLDDPAKSTEELRKLIVGNALQVRAAAVLGDSAAALEALDQHRLLCAHREGPHGVEHWNRQARRWICDHTGDPAWAQWYPGRPLLVTANDYALGLRNGDTGVVITDHRGGDDGLRAVIDTAPEPVDLAAGRLTDVDTMYAMTIHKSQGSEAAEISVLMPPVESRLLTRELFYTAVTRAKRTVRIVGTEEEIRAALARRVSRASGLARRLRDG